jgi:putative ABC transport system permease protein
VDLMFDSNQFDMVLRFTRPWAADSLEAAVAEVPGVARTEAWGAARAAFRDPDGRLGSTFPISAPPAATQMFVPRFRSGRWPAPADGNALLINRRLLTDEPRLVPGDTLTLVIGGRAALWNIIGVVDTGPSPVAYTCRETLTRITGKSRMDRVVVAATPSGPATHLDLIQRLRAHVQDRGIAVQTSQLMAPARRVMEDHLLMVAGFLGVMAQLMIVVGGLGLASTMSLGVLERTREIGVLRAIGARHASILFMVQVEGLVAGILSWAIALPLSIPMGVILGKAFGRIMMPVPAIYVPQLPAVLQWLGVVIAVSIVACAVPAFRATRIPTAAALAYE